MRDPHTGVLRRKVQHFDVPGHAHALNFSCFRNHPFLRSDRAKGWLADSLIRAMEMHRLHLWAWVIMPTHAHVLYLPTNERTRTRDVLLSIKLPVAKRAVACVKARSPAFLERMADTSPTSGKSIYRFWQRGPGFDRNLWSAAAIWNMIDYIHNNPVEAGYCAKAEDWEWSSARAYVLGASARIPVNVTRLPARPTQAS